MTTALQKPAANADVGRLLAALAEQAVEGYLSVPLPRPEQMPKQAAEAAGQALIESGHLVRDGQRWRLVLPESVPKRRERPAQVPTKPCTQSEHRKALWTSKNLKEDPLVLLAALAVHNMIGVRQKARFGEQPERLSASLIAAESGMSERKATAAIRVAVELGFFRRVDSGKGGRGRKGSTAAAYVPCLPTWWS